MIIDAEGQDCSGCAIENYWCNINPVGYSQVSVSAEQQGRISCSIPNQTGQDILLFNHYGDDVRTDPLLSNYIQQFPVSVNSIENVRIYSFNISWSGDSTVQDKFRVLQCIGIFHGTTQTCKTSVVNIQFENSQGIYHQSSAVCLLVIITRLRNATRHYCGMSLSEDKVLPVVYPSCMSLPLRLLVIKLHLCITFL